MAPVPLEQLNDPIKNGTYDDEERDMNGTNDENWSPDMIIPRRRGASIVTYD